MCSRQIVALGNPTHPLSGDRSLSISYPHSGGNFWGFQYSWGGLRVTLIAGHKDTKMLMRYTHLRAEDLVGRLGSLLLTSHCKSFYLNLVSICQHKSGLNSGHDRHNDSLASSRISPRSCCQGIFSIQVEMGLVCPLCHDAGRSRSPAGRPNFRLESMWHWFSSIAQRTRNLGLCDLVLGARSAPRIDWALDPHGT